jgi:hypothetical protein
LTTKTNNTENAAEQVEVIGARVHNLKNIDVTIPRNALTVITGLSGSGKSSLAFDTIFAEGQRRYIETFSAYARSFLGNMERPDVDKITGLSPVISIDQKTTNKNPPIYSQNAVPQKFSSKATILKINALTAIIKDDKIINKNAPHLNWIFSPILIEMKIAPTIIKIDPINWFSVRYSFKKIKAKR